MKKLATTALFTTMKNTYAAVYTLCGWEKFRYAINYIHYIFSPCMIKQRLSAKRFRIQTNHYTTENINTHFPTNNIIRWDSIVNKLELLSNII